jgi:YhcH/YjgK/YiaL family protein
MSTRPRPGFVFVAIVLSRACLLQTIGMRRRSRAFPIVAAALMAALAGCSERPDPASWSNSQIDEWFNQGQWLNGWHARPDPSINRRAFAIAYFRNKERWDNAFHFLQSHDLSKLEPNRYDIEGDNLYAQVSEYLTKNEEDAKYEAHRKYIDIQYVVHGKERIGVAPLSRKHDVLQPYDPAKDVEIMTFDHGVNHNASPETFFIFFPDDAHRPGLEDGANEQVRKTVVKVKVD